MSEVKEQIIQRWELFQVWFHGLSLRERVIVVAGVCGVLGLLWFTIFVEPAQKANVRSVRAQEAKQKEIASLTLEEAEITGQLGKDPNAEFRKQIERLTQLNAGLDRQVKELSTSWITPAQMADALRSVLAQRGRLKLISMTSEPPKSLNGGAAGGRTSASGDSAQDIYVHGMALVFEGSFFDVLGYLEALEKSPWNFFWESLDYTVESFPTATVRLHVKTYSADRAWIGV